MKNFILNTWEKVWGILVRYSSHRFYYPYLYKSRWHLLIHGANQQIVKDNLYYAARPNPGAGIGHQMANWIAGLWFSQKFGLQFAHMPFSSNKWDEFLGFGYHERTVEELKKSGFILRHLPLFDEYKEEDLKKQMQIISSYSGQKVVFIAEQDQFYKDQFGVINIIQDKFFQASSRNDDHLKYNKENFNIAIHVRRGDIMKDPSKPNLTMRYLSNDYFYRVLRQVINHTNSTKEVHIYFFSQGESKDYPEFNEFKNLHWCFDMSAQQSFLHMVYADVLITSKSSFSYKPALLNKNGIKVCPRNFWHSYPSSPDWIMCSDEGEVDFQSDSLSLND